MHVQIRPWNQQCDYHAVVIVYILLGEIAGLFL